MTDVTATDLTARAATMFQEVLRRTHLSSAPDLGSVLAEEARAIGADALVLYVVDYEQKWLVPVPGPDAAARDVLQSRGRWRGVRSRPARSSRSSWTANPAAGFGCRSWTARSGSARWRSRSWDPSGRCPSRPDRLRALCPPRAILIATKSMYSDFFELARRQQPMTVASELLWELVPPLVLAADDFVLAALLEPCYDMGGDAFDYALNDGVLHLAVFDGMGHGLAAAGVTAFALSAYRHSRRNSARAGGHLRRRRPGAV